MMLCSQQLKENNFEPLKMADSILSFDLEPEINIKKKMIVWLIDRFLQKVEQE